MNTLILAAVAIWAGGGLLSALLYLLLTGIGVGLIWWTGTWFLGRFGGPGIVKTILDGLFILISLIAVINFLMGLGGHPFIVW